MTKQNLFKGKSEDEALDENKRYRINLQILQAMSVPKVAQDLAKKLLDINPKSRITAKAALEHPFFNSEAIFSIHSLSPLPNPANKAKTLKASQIKNKNCSQFSFVKTEDFSSYLEQQEIGFEEQESISYVQQLVAENDTSKIDIPVLHPN